MKMTQSLLAALLLSGLMACSSRPPMQSPYPDPHLTPPTHPVPSPPDQEIRNASDKNGKADYNRQNMNIRPAVSVGYGYHRGWRPYHRHFGGGFYSPYYDW
ncbi:hypothetical protein A1D23_03135 [Chelonobacter oris]|uniref:Lipoprotein n=2 Tax=Chelonobacter oris TaxID=505317 RepID=A0A0A3AW21_9PAST|nr:hypothetical protein OA57_03370 [Chelonobacter oris]MDH3001603.1 hypothetical protein [Chelonobacter oris]